MWKEMTFVYDSNSFFAINEYVEKCPHASKQ